MAGIFRGLAISAQALTAQRLRMDIVASNIANKDTTRTPEGGPYRKQSPVFIPEVDAKGRVSGVRVAEITESDAVQRVYDPAHPDADADGLVSYPDIDLVAETTDLMAAQRAYQLNTNVFSVARGIIARALDLIGQR